MEMQRLSPFSTSFETMRVPEGAGSLRVNMNRRPHGPLCHAPPASPILSQHPLDQSGDEPLPLLLVGFAAQEKLLDLDSSELFY